MTQPSTVRLLTESQSAPIGTTTPNPLGIGAAGATGTVADAGHIHPSAGLFADYGTGSDGDVVLDGTTDFTGLTRTGSVYVMNSAMFFRDLTINTGVTLRPSGHIIYVLGTLSGAGTIQSDTGKTTAAGGSSAFVELLPGGVGPAGGTGVGATGVVPNSTGVVNAASGAGGASGTGNAGGAAPTISSQFVNAGKLLKRYQDPLTAFRGILFLSDWGQATPTATANPLAGGCSGGAGGGDGTNAGGKGGNGGQAVIVCARKITGTVTISAPGENGGAAAGGNAGGGGGGAGGLAILNTTDTTGWTGALSAPGGTGGAKAGTGVAGSAGSAGITRQNLWS